MFAWVLNTPLIFIPFLFMHLIDIGCYFRFMHLTLDVFLDLIYLRLGSLYICSYMSILQFRVNIFVLLIDPQIFLLSFRDTNTLLLNKIRVFYQHFNLRTNLTFFIIFRNFGSTADVVRFIQ